MTEPDGRLERYVAGEMTPEERRTFEKEVLADPALADALYRDASARAALETAARARTEAAAGVVSAASARRRTPWRWLAPVAAAAAVVAVLVLNGGPGGEDAPTFRGTGVDSTAFAPRGRVDALPARLAWAPVDGAHAYRIELFDSTSTRVLGTVTSATSLAVGDEVPVPRNGFWSVTPLDDVRVAIGDPVVLRYQVID